MDWLEDLVKNLAISRTLVVAIFITSVVMYVGPLVKPDLVPQLQKDFVPALFGTMILSGCLLVLWLVSGIWSIVSQGFKKTAQTLSNGTLTEGEMAILHVLGKNPTSPLDLEEIDYSRAPATKLEFHHLVSQLVDKGLAYTNDFDENLVSLTKQGRDRALALHREWKSKSAS